MEGFEVGVRRVTEIRTPSLGYRIQRSRAKKESQEAHWSEFRSASINNKPKRKSVTFSNVISNDKSRTSPSAEIYSLHMGNGRDGEEKDKPACSNKEETIVISEMKETVQFPTGHENQEVGMTSNKFADSLPACMDVPQDNWGVTERFDIAGQMKPIELDKPIKSDTPDFQTIWDQASTVDIQTKPLKDLQNENIQNVTMKRLREIRFSPTTFKRRNLSASDLTEQISFSRIVSKGAECRAEDIPMLPDNQRHKLHMEPHESYHIDLTAQENAETRDKRECSKEKVEERRKLHYHYEVKDEIGRGSYSFVKRVVNKQNGTHCAAKCITLRRGIKAYEELAILCKLNHSKIACLLDKFETKRTLVLVLEMCSNEGLLDHLLKKNIVAEAKVRNYIQQILEGVLYLHNNNILHLDIKPANILMVHPERDDIKICDFGFAQELLLDKLQFSEYGCPEFVAPEIVSQDPISTATDIWSIGVITFLCLTGNCPFSGENDRITLLNVKEGRFSWNEHDLDCTTENARSFVRRIIKLIPKDRPTASECLNDRWFQEKQKVQQFCTINTKRLKLYLSRNKWQRSLMCYKSILVKRSIPQLFEEPSKIHSLGMPQHLLKQSSSTTSSASSSDFEDCGQQTEPSSYHASVISQRPAPFPTDILDIAASEHRSQRSVLTGIIAVEKQTDVRDQTSGKSDDVKVQCNSPEIFKDLNLSTKRIKYSIVKAASVEISDFSRMEMVVTHKLTRAISADSVLTPQVLTKDALLDSNAKPPSRLLPRHCLIGRESVIRKPLLDYFPMGAQESIAKDKRFDESLSHSSRELYKTASCDTVHRAAYVPKEKLRKSKSLDEYGTESVVQTTRESASELINSCFQSSDLDSNAKATGRPMVTLPFSIDEQVLGTQKSALSDTMCLSEGVTFYTDVLQYPTKGTSSEMDQSLQTLESLEKEQSMDTEDKAYATDIKDYNSKGNSSALPSLQHSLDLQNKHQELSQSIQDIETSCNSKLSELKTKTEKVQNDEEPINLYSNVSGISSLDSKVSTDSELHKKNSAASVDAAEPQTQSSSKNVSSLYYDAAETDANYFDLLEPNNSRELHYEHGPLCLAHEFKEKSTSQVKSLPEPCTSEEPSSSRETDVSKDNPPRAKSNRSSTTSYELLCNETEPVSENLCGLIAAEWESDLLELLEGSEEDEIMSEFEEGESKSKKKSKRISLESKIYQSFISLKKAFKGQQDARAPISSSKTSLIVGESHNDPGLKSTSKTFGTSGLLKLLNRSASLNWDKDFQDGDRGGSRHSLSAFLGGGKSQTLPARFSWQSLKSKDSAERPELRKKQQELSKVQRRASSSGMESADNQYMEFMKVPLIPSFTQHHTDSEKQQASMCSTDTSDNAIGSLKIKSRLFSFKIPGSKSKEKAPSFLEELQDQSVVLSQTVTLSCRTSGYPNPKIHWFKDNQLMCRSDRILSSTTSTKCQLLTILNVGEEDLGNYKCVAENHLDKASTCCLLNLADLPCCPDSPEVVQVFEDGALVIWKPLVSSMPVTYVIECQKKGKGWQTIASDLSENCFYPSNLSRGDAYLYRIAYVNKAGTGPFSHPSAEIIIGETEIQSHSLHGEMPASLQETYTFLAEISRGRFSIIKKCVENSTGKLLASKITRYKKKKKPFVLKEYETLKKLHHCNIVQLHGAYITPKYFVLIQELCRGKELFHYLAERSCYSEHHVVELLAQILGAVEYLHLNQILHLDLRSENMIIVEHNILKLLDFGNAEIHMPGRPVLVEKFSDFVENMAPEILERKAAVRETDIWAVGVVTFTMLSGDCPFRSDKDYDKEKNIRKGKIKYGRCYAGLSQGAVSFLKNTLCLNPGGRMCASECRSFSWLQEETKMKLTSSTVSFQTAKLRNFLKQQEKQRMLLCTKHKVLIVQ